jgi:hypothetical protein
VYIYFRCVLWFYMCAQLFCMHVQNFTCVYIVVMWSYFKYYVRTAILHVFYWKVFFFFFFFKLNLLYVEFQFTYPQSFYMSTVILHVHSHFTCPLSFYMSTVILHVYCHFTCLLSFYMSTVILVLFISRKQIQLIDNIHENKKSVINM